MLFFSGGFFRAETAAGFFADPLMGCPRSGFFPPRIGGCLRFFWLCIATVIAIAAAAAAVVGCFWGHKGLEAGFCSWVHSAPPGGGGLLRLVQKVGWVEIPVDPSPRGGLLAGGPPEAEAEACSEELLKD